MRLNALFEDDPISSVWSQQKRKMVRVVWGLTVGVLALIGVIGLFIFLRKDVAQASLGSRDLAELMRLRAQAESLQNQLQKPSPARPVASVRSSAPDSDVFVSTDPGEGFVNVSAPKEGAYIPTGAVFQAELITPIKTSVQRTFVMAEVTAEYRMDMKRRIPRGSRLIGRSRLDPILRGVVVEFETLVLPSGQETAVSGLGLSRNALPNIEGLYFSDRLQNYGTALAFGFLSGFADAARTREVTTLGSQPEISVSNQVLAGLSTASFQVAEDLLRDLRARAIEYVVVPAGERIFVALTRRYDIQQGESR